MCLPSYSLAMWIVTIWMQSQSEQNTKLLGAYVSDWRHLFPWAYIMKLITQYSRLMKQSKQWSMLLFFLEEIYKISIFPLRWNTKNRPYKSNDPTESKANITSLVKSIIKLEDIFSSKIALLCHFLQIRV